MRYLLPLILIGAAATLFIAYTNPHYQGSIKALQTQQQAYDDALTKSQELKALRDQLLSKYNTFSTEDRDKLQEFLPDNIDNIQLVIDINGIAARHNLAIKNMQIGETKVGPSSGRSSSAKVAVGTSNGTVGSVDFGFTVSADYETFLAFLADLEHSLRLIDVEKVAFSVNETGLNDYTLSIRTYWLH